MAWLENDCRVWSDEQQPIYYKVQSFITSTHLLGHFAGYRLLNI